MMSIDFQCKHCGKNIQAPDKLAGKRGKCPKCRNTLVIPELQQADDQPLQLSPLDENEEIERKRLLSETYNVTQTLLNERAVPEETPIETDLPSDPTDISYMISATPVDTKELKQNTLQYFRLLASGDQEQASQYAQLIVPHYKEALEILDDIALNDLSEPELAHIPPHMLSGLIRDLRAQIMS
jgi:hypothetical protein